MASASRGGSSEEKSYQGPAHTARSCGSSQSTGCTTSWKVMNRCRLSPASSVYQMPLPTDASVAHSQIRSP